MNSIGGRRICVDHCHRTGVVRGFLCNKCNTILGLAGDSPNMLLKLANYLKPNPAGDLK